MSGKSNSKILSFALLAAIAVAGLLCFIYLSPFLSLSLFSSFLPAKPTLSESMLKDLPPLEIGDVILREGVGSDSAVIKQVSRHRYSHVGLVVNAKPILILHATTDDNKMAQNQVILSSFDEFLSLAKAIAIKRYGLSKTDREQIATYAMSWEGRAFVLRAREMTSEYVLAQEKEQNSKISESRLMQSSSLDSECLESSPLASHALEKSALKSNHLEANEPILYCTTLLEQILSPYAKLSLSYEFVDIPFFRGEYLYPKAFYMDYNSRLIYEFSL